MIRGYGHVKARHLASARPKWDALMADWRAGPLHLGSLPLAEHQPSESDERRTPCLAQASRLATAALTAAGLAAWRSGGRSRWPRTPALMHTGPVSAEIPVPQTQYAESDGLSIAYQVFGQGPTDLVFVPARLASRVGGDAELRADVS